MSTAAPSPPDAPTSSVAKARIEVDLLAASVVQAVHRLAKQATLYEDDNEARVRQLDATAEAVRAYSMKTGRNVSLFWMEQSVFVGRRLLHAGRSIYTAALELAQILKPLDVSQLVIGYDVPMEELIQLQEVFRDLQRRMRPSIEQLSFTRIRLRRAPDLDRRFVDERHLPPEERVMRTYAKAVVVMRRFVEQLQRGDTHLPIRVRRVAQQLTDIASSHSSGLMAVAVLHSAQNDDAARAVNSGILALLMAQQLGVNPRLLSRVATAALLMDAGRPRVAGLDTAGDVRMGTVMPRIGEEQYAELPGATATVLTLLGGVNDSSMMQTAAVCEALHVQHAEQLGPPYGGLRRPTTMARIIAMARRFTALNSDIDAPDRPIAEIITSLQLEATDPVDQNVFRLLAAVLQIYPTGALVELSTGELAQVVDTPSDPSKFSKPMIRVIVGPDGERLTRPRPLHLALQPEGPDAIELVRVVALPDEAQLRAALESQRRWREEQQQAQAPASPRPALEADDAPEVVATPFEPSAVVASSPLEVAAEEPSLPGPPQQAAVTSEPPGAWLTELDELPPPSSQRPSWVNEEVELPPELAAASVMPTAPLSSSRPSAAEPRPPIAVGPPEPHPPTSELAAPPPAPSPPLPAPPLAPSSPLQAPPVAPSPLPAEPPLAPSPVPAEPPLAPSPLPAEPPLAPSPPLQAPPPAPSPEPAAPPLAPSPLPAEPPLAPPVSSQPIAVSAKPPAPADDAGRRVSIPPPEQPTNVQGQPLAARAKGTLSKTPILHLLIYVADRRLSGSLVLDSPTGGRFVLHVEDGAPCKIFTSRQVAPLDRVLLKMGLVEPDVLHHSLRHISQTGELHGEYLIRQGHLEEAQLAEALTTQLVHKAAEMFGLPPETRFAFYEGVNLLAQYGGEELTPCDPLQLVMAGVRRKAGDPEIDVLLGRLGDHVLTVHPDADIDRLRLNEYERQVEQLLRAQPLRYADLAASEVVQERVLKLTVYALLVTRSLKLASQAKPPLAVKTQAQARAAHAAWVQPPSQPQATPAAPASVSPASLAFASAPPPSQPAVSSAPLATSEPSPPPPASQATPPPTSAPSSQPAVSSAPLAASEPSPQPPTSQATPQPTSAPPSEPAVSSAPPAASEPSPQPPTSQATPQPTSAPSSQPAASSAPPSAPPESQRSLRPKAKIRGLRIKGAGPDGAEPPPSSRSAPPAQRVSQPAPARAGRPSAAPRQARTPAPSRKPAAARATRQPSSTAPASARAAAADEGPVRAEVRALYERLAEINFFELLGVEEDSPFSVIQKAYLEAAKKWHPDRFGAKSPEEKTAVSKIFARMNDAFQTLSKADKREAYLERLAKGDAAAKEEEQVTSAIEAALEFQKAEVALRRSDWPAAEQSARIAHEADPDQPEYLTVLAWAQAQLLGPPPSSGIGAKSQHYEEQIGMLTDVIEREPEYERALFYRAKLHREGGAEKAAMRDFKKVVVLNPDNVDAAREVRIDKMRKGQLPKKKKGWGGLFG